MNTLKFERRPAPVITDHRPMYKIGQILLILHLSSRGGKSSSARLHLFNWALKSDERIGSLVKASTSKILSITAWGFDPALAIAIRYATGEKLIVETPNGYQLTDSGESLARKICADRSVLTREFEHLSKIGKAITESMIDKVAKGWAEA